MLVKALDFTQARIPRARGSTAHCAEGISEVIAPRMKIVRVPTLKDDGPGLERMIRLWSEATAANDGVRLDLAGCRFIGQAGTAFLAGLVANARERRVGLDMDWRNAVPAVATNLAQNGFREFVTGDAQPWTGNSIPLRVDQPGSAPESREVIDYLRHKWLGRGWVKVTPALSAHILGKVWEIYENAFEHGRSEIGVFSCGQRFPNKRELHLTVVDFGRSIPGTVRTFLRDSDLSGADAMRWAFTRGNTTRLGASGGLGLDLLHEFVKVNGGELRVVSGDGQASVASSQSFGSRAKIFPGTMVNIMLRCEPSLYCLTSELTGTTGFF